jgi:hypothetical protein
MVLPKNVFTTCPKANGKVMIVTTEYKILDPSGRELMIVKDRRISLADIRKAAKCARMTTFNVRKVMTPVSRINLEARDFPVSCNVMLVKVESITPTTPRMITTPKFKIFKTGGILLQIVENYITLVHLEKAAKCAGYKKYAVFTSTSNNLVLNRESKITQDVYIRNVTDAISIPNHPHAYKIIKASDGYLLMVVEGPITLTHLEKAAKCAGFKKYSVYVNQKRVLPNSTTAIKNNVELRKAVAKKVTHKSKHVPHVFNVCDQPITIKKSTKKVKMSKKQLLNTAIAALTELGKTL